MQIVFKPNGERLELLSLQYLFWLFDRIERQVSTSWSSIEEIRITEHPLGARTCTVVVRNPRNGRSTTLGPIDLGNRQEPTSQDTFEAMVEVLGHADRASREVVRSILLYLNT